MSYIDDIKVLHNKLNTIYLLKKHEVVLRVGTKKDVQLWQKFHSCISDKTRRMRYNGTISVNKIIENECINMDYELSIPILALIEGNIVAIVHISVYIESNTADFSIIVADKWQKCGLGTLLMSYSLDILKKLDIETVIGQTERFNHGMINLFKSFNFKLKFDEGWDASRKVVLS